MNISTKKYKIFIDSKQFGNIQGITPAESAKKAASKILNLSNNKTSHFSVQAKTGKI
jgi:hypothetical protein